jgi:hypothetical protein
VLPVHGVAQRPQTRSVFGLPASCWYWLSLHSVHRAQLRSLVFVAGFVSHSVAPMHIVSAAQPPPGVSYSSPLQSPPDTEAREARTSKAVFIIEAVLVGVV